jgi:hypothetical protein
VKVIIVRPEPAARQDTTAARSPAIVCSVMQAPARAAAGHAAPDGIVVQLRLLPGLVEAYQALVERALAS